MRTETRRDEADEATHTRTGQGRAVQCARARQPTTTTASAAAAHHRRRPLLTLALLHMRRAAVSLCMPCVTARLDRMDRVDATDAAAPPFRRCR